MIIAKCSSKFEYRLYDRQGLELGVMKLPTYIAVPMNGWAAGVLPDRLKDHVKINVDSRGYRIDYELLSDRVIRGNDLKFFLMDGEDTVISTDAYIHKGKRWKFKIDGNSYELIKKGGIFSSMCFHLNSNSRKIGQISESTGFTLWKRTFEIDLPNELGHAIQVFMFFLAVNATYR